jgi:hypothetical protein
VPTLKATPESAKRDENHRTYAADSAAQIAAAASEVELVERQRDARQSATYRGAVGRVDERTKIEPAKAMSSRAAASTDCTPSRSPHTGAASIVSSS